jgi:hypothetical protein
MNYQDLNRLARNEKTIMDAQTINFIRDIPDFPYSSLGEIQSAIESGAITITTDFGVLYQPDLFWAFGTRGEILTWCFWITLLGILYVAYVAVALHTGKHVYLWGLATASLGVLLSGPGTSRIRIPILGLSTLVILYFILTYHPGAWVVAGFDVSLILVATAIAHMHFVLINRALHSEVLFCYMHTHRIIRLESPKTDSAKTHNLNKP